MKAARIIYLFNSAAWSFAVVLVSGSGFGFFHEVAVGVHAVLSLRAVLLMFSLHCFTKNHHSRGNPGCGYTGIQREIALSGSGGAAQLPGGSPSRSPIHCNLYLRHV